MLNWFKKEKQKLHRSYHGEEFNMERIDEHFRELERDIELTGYSNFWGEMYAQHVLVRADLEPYLQQPFPHLLWLAVANMKDYPCGFMRDKIHRSMFTGELGQFMADNYKGSDSDDYDDKGYAAQFIFRDMVEKLRPIVTRKDLAELNTLLDDLAEQVKQPKAELDVEEVWSNVPNEKGITEIHAEDVKLSESEIEQIKSMNNVPGQFTTVNDIESKRAKLCATALDEEALKTYNEVGERVETKASGAKQNYVEEAFELVPYPVIGAIASTMKEGLEKYGYQNYYGIPMEEHMGRAIRHMFKHLSGDTTEDHLGHAITRLGFAIEMKDNAEKNGGYELFAHLKKPNNESDGKQLTVHFPLELSREQKASVDKLASEIHKLAGCRSVGGKLISIDYKLLMTDNGEICQSSRQIRESDGSDYQEYVEDDDSEPTVWDLNDPDTMRKMRDQSVDEMK